jgi:hypothetical protein
VVAFAAGVGLVLLYALRGGSYDIVVFEEYGLVIWWTLALGIAFGVLPRARPSRVVLLLLGALLAYAAWTALSLTWTASAERTTVEIARTLDYLGLVAIIALAVDRETWRSAAAGLGLGALIVCLLAVGSRLFPGAFPVDYVNKGLDISRLSYPFGYWNAVGAWGAMSAALGLIWSAHDGSAWRRSVALGLVPAAVLATYMSYSRAGVAALGLAAILALALSRNRPTALLHVLIAAAGSAIAILAVRGEPAIADGTGTRGAGVVVAMLLLAVVICAGVAFATLKLRSDTWSVPRSLSRPLLIVLALAVLVSGAAFGPRLASDGWHSFTRISVVVPTNPSQRLLSLSGTRYLVWKSALHAFDQNPFTGTGAGTFELWWNQHATTYESLQDAHSLWLQNLAELGAPGLLLIVLLAVAAVATGIVVRRRTRRRASAGISAAFLGAFIVFLANASVDWMWESTAVTVLALAGIAVISGRLSTPKPRLAPPVRGGLTLLALGAALLQLPGLLSTIDIRNSQAAERAGNGAAALADANDAVSAEPWAASSYDQRGTVLESAGELSAAASNLRTAIAHEPTEYTHWLLLARVQAERGDLTAAVSDYNTARRLRPRGYAFIFAPEFTLTRR